jgi:4-amino-4-deoxy-L-arabinose transferase-like glycosyltransferase
MALLNAKRSFLFILLLVFLCTPLFFLGLGTRPLWDTDEGMHAETSKEMVLSGDWITPTFNGERFYDKPILHSWFVALSFLIFGFTEFAARFPAALLGLGGVLLTYLLGKRMFGSTAGLVSGVILATSLEYFLLTQTVVHDSSLAFFMLLALFCFYTAYRDERHRGWYFGLFYTSLGLCVLSKGPLGLGLPGLIVGLFLLLRKRLGFLKEMRIGWGVVIFLAVAAPWYVLISLRNPGYAGYFFIQNNLMRFASSHARHHEPFYFYVPVLFGGLLPWSFLLPTAFVRSFRISLGKIREDELFLLLWLFSVFGFFSLASSKLPTYLLPLFPAGALLLGALWKDLMERPTPGLQKWVFYSCAVFMGSAVLGLAYSGFHPPSGLKTDYDLDLLRFKWYGVAFMLGLAASFWLLLRRKWNTFFLSFVGLFVAMVLFSFLSALPLVNDYRSTKGLAEEMDRMLPSGEKFLSFRVLRQSSLFYTDHRGVLVKSSRELRSLMQSDRTVFCIMRKIYFDRDEQLKRMTSIAGEAGDKILISNRKQPDGAFSQ